jgi:hypothetical protein
MDDADYMVDAEGRLVPSDKVRPEHKLEDQLVNELISIARYHHNLLFDFKARAFADVAALMDLLAEKYQARRGGRKGNLTLTSYDGLRRVQIQNADYIQFGPELKIAKDLIDECITSWSDGINVNLKALVDRAFEVNKEGKLNTAEILGLRRLNITDPVWGRAMTAINDSMKVSFSRSYIRFYERRNLDAAWSAITLDLASI